MNCNNSEMLQKSAHEIPSSLQYNEPVPAERVISVENLSTEGIPCY